MMKITTVSPLLLPLLATLALITLSGCTNPLDKEFPVLGEATREFSYQNQDGETVTREVFTDKIVVTDFFFTTCPTICPIMKRQMHRVYEAYKDNDEILLFSHTIDPEHDTVEVLNNFATGLGINSQRWQMVTGDQDDIFAMAKHYMLGALKNDEVPGGYIHSGSFVLIDKKGQVRAYYNGTDEAEVDKLIEDLKVFTDAQ